MERSKWRAEPTMFGDKILFQAVMDLNGSKVMRGGLYKTMDEAQEEADRLNEVDDECNR